MVIPWSGGICRRVRRCLWIGSILASSLSAQGLFEVVDVPVVEVNVVVTDRRDQMITDLTRDDFTLWIDGRQQSIDFFSAPGTSADDAELRPHPIHLVILFDNNGIEALDRNAIVSEIKDFASSGLTPSAHVLIASIGLGGLDIQQEFTDDPGAIELALDRVSETVTRDRNLAAYQALLREIQRVAGVRDPTLPQLRSRAMTLVGQIQAFSDQARQQVETTGGLLWEVVESLSGLPGRKAILFVGGAMPINAGEVLLSALREILSRTDDVGAQQAAARLPATISASGGDAVQSLALAASSHRVAVYPIVAGGAEPIALTGGSAASSGTGDSSQTDSSTTWSPGVDFRNRMETGAAHAALAAATGGFVHTGDRGVPAALGRVEDELVGSYVLGFQPKVASEGQPHRIRIDVAGKRLRIRHRQTFEVSSLDQESAARVRSGLLFGADDNPLQASLEVRPSREDPAGTGHLALRVRVPLDRIALQPIDRSHRGQLSVFVTSGGERFRAQPVRKSVLPIVVANDEIQGALGQAAEFRLDVEPQELATRLAVGIRDDLEPELSVLRVDLSWTDPVTTIAETTGPSSLSHRRAGANPVLTLPTAALVLSGQNGGPIDLAATATVEPLAEDRWRVPVEIDIGNSDDTSEAAREVFVYALTPEGRVDTEVSRATQQRRSTVPLDLPRGMYTLRVVVRDPADGSFGVTGMDIQIPRAADGLARWSSPPVEAPNEVVRVSHPAVATPTGGLTVGTADVEAMFRQVVARLAAGDDSGARSLLREFEIGAVGGRTPRAAIDLGRLEARVLIDLGAGDWGRLMPFAVLYGDMIDEYRQRRQSPLSENAMQISSEMAQQMARKARDRVAASEAADLLTSLAGYLLYSQRIGRTQELLELAVRKDSTQVTARLALAAVHEQQGEYAAAVAVLEPLVAFDPANAEARLRLGVNRARIGEIPGALVELDRIVDIEGQEWVQQVAVQEAARIRIEQGQVKRAQEDLERAAVRWPEQPAFRAQLAWLLDLEGSPVAAADWVETLLHASKAAAESARYRYLDWYTTGLEELREKLVGQSHESARTLQQMLDSDDERRSSP